MLRQNTAYSLANSQSEPGWNDFTVPLPTHTPEIGKAAVQSRMNDLVIVWLELWLWLSEPGTYVCEALSLALIPTRKALFTYSAIRGWLPA